MPVPYLDHPPAVIPIDVGRQLLVDDFLIEQTTLKRTFHRARYHPDNPIIKPDKPWEHRGRAPTAMVFSDGVWYDPADKLFKAWYMGGHRYPPQSSRDGHLLRLQPGWNPLDKAFVGCRRARLESVGTS